MPTRTPPLVSPFKNRRCKQPSERAEGNAAGAHWPKLQAQWRLVVGATGELVAR